MNHVPNGTSLERDELFKQLIEHFQSFYRSIQRRQHNTANALPYGQKAALITIANHTDCNIKQIARVLGVTSGAATQHVDALVDASLVERVHDVHDRRTVMVRLSKRGNTVIKAIQQERLLLMKQLFKDVQNEELAALNDIFQKVNSKQP